MNANVYSIHDDERLAKVMRYSKYEVSCVIKNPKTNVYHNHKLLDTDSVIGAIYTLFRASADKAYSSVSLRIRNTIADA